MFLYGLIAKPPINLAAPQVGLDLILCMRVEYTARDATWQNGQDLVFIAQVSYHPQRSEMGYAKWIIKLIPATAECLSGAGCGM